MLLFLLVLAGCTAADVRPTKQHGSRPTSGGDTDVPPADTDLGPADADPEPADTDTVEGDPDQAPGDADTSGADADTGGDPDDGAGDVDPVIDDTPTRYPAELLVSPLTPSVAERLQTIAAADQGRAEDVFMKVGASGTVSKNLLFCFAGEAQPQYDLELDGRDDLMSSIEHFRAGDAAGSTPFDRVTLAASVGKTASWAITGDPSPLEQEVQATNPRFAFVNYGTNDMGMGTSYATALPPFYENMSALLDQLEAEGIIPIVSGLNPRTDSAGAARWVPSYDAVTRGLAEARQLPYISLYLASKDLPGSGLLADGIHGNTYYSGGTAQPCVFTPAALAYNYNVRNLLSIEVLDWSKRMLLDDDAAPDAPVLHSGLGTLAAPLTIDALPFSHAADTGGSSERQLDTYTGCSASQDESGPEVYYRLELEESTALRAIVLDRAGVDVDLHLLSGEPEAAECTSRADKIIDRVVPAGVWYFVLDTYVNASGVEQDGPYLFVVLRCEPGDPDC